MFCYKSIIFNYTKHECENEMWEREFERVREWRKTGSEMWNFPIPEKWEKIGKKSLIIIFVSENKGKTSHKFDVIHEKFMKIINYQFISHWILIRNFPSCANQL